MDELVGGLAGLSLAGKKGKEQSRDGGCGHGKTVIGAADSVAAPSSWSWTNLRQYQKDLVFSLLKKQMNDDGKSRVLVYLPTGGGKTVVAGYLAQSCARKGKRCVFVVNRNRLCEQTAAVFSRFGLEKELTYIKSGHDYDPSRRVVVASIQTFSKRFLSRSERGVGGSGSRGGGGGGGGGGRGGGDSSGSVHDDDDDDDNNDDDGGLSQALSALSLSSSKAAAAATPAAADKAKAAGAAKATPTSSATPPAVPQFDLVMVDEAHCCFATQYRRFLASQRRARVVGLTATPFRLNPDEQLSKIFAAQVCGPSVTELIRRGSLVPPRVCYGAACAREDGHVRSKRVIDLAVSLWKRHCVEGLGKLRRGRGRGRGRGGGGGVVLERGQSAPTAISSSPAAAVRQAQDDDGGSGGDSGNKSDNSNDDVKDDDDDDDDDDSNENNGNENNRNDRARSTVVFCTNIDHSIRCRDAFLAAGVAAEHIDGEATTKERKVKE